MLESLSNGFGKLTYNFEGQLKCPGEPYPSHVKNSFTSKNVKNTTILSGQMWTQSITIYSINLYEY